MASEKTKKAWKIVAIVLSSIIGLIILTLLGYVIYLSATYYRIADNQTLQIENPKTANISLNERYVISTYNIGFGAYSQDFSFFMDSGKLKDGTAVQGTGSRAKDKATVELNTSGAVNEIKALNADFILFQEVDVKAHRSHFVNQLEYLKAQFGEYSSTFAYNFHSGYLFYPLTEPHGKVDAGIATFSKYQIQSSVRRSFPIDESFFQKFFDLDRCFSVNRINIQGTDKQLVLINQHMSAYDKGGTVRAKQLKMLNDFIEYEYNTNGNYVIVGGDFNHDISNSDKVFDTIQEVPEWVQRMTDDDLAPGFKFATATNAPTCRSTDMPYTAGHNYSSVLDGFIVSENVNIVDVENIDTQFMYSDHNPVKFVFSLNA